MVNLWHISSINWLTSLPAEKLTSLREAAKLFTFEAGRLIFEPEPQPKYVYLLETGLVRMYRLDPRALVVTLGYIQSGEVFGELAVFSDQPRESYAEATSRSTVIRIERDAFLQAVRSEAQLSFTIATQISGRFKEIESRVEDLVFRSARARLARIIRQLAQSFASTYNNSTMIDLRLTHAELATLVGTSRPTVSIALGELEDDGIVSRNDGKIVITDEDRLRQEAEQTG